MRLAQIILGFVVCCSAKSASGLTENFTPEMGDYVFFSVVISAIVFSTAIILAYRSYRWLAYVGFAVLLLLNHAATGGVVAYVIGATDFVLFVVPYLVFGGLVSYGFWMAGWLLDVDHSLVRFRRLFYGLAILAALGPATSFVWLLRIPLNLMWLPEQFLYLVMIAAQILPPLSWDSQSLALRRYVRTFPVIIVLFIIGSSTVSQLFLDLSQDQQNILSRITIAIFVLFSLALVLWQAFATSKGQEASERRALEAAKSEAELQLALMQAEKEYEKAQGIAMQHRDQLARVSHDLKQPLAALRVAAANIETGAADEGAETGLARAVDYVDQLAKSYGDRLDDEGEDVPLDEESAEVVHGSEAVSVQTFGTLLTQMFSRETQRRNIEFTIRTLDVSVNVVPIMAMRIMTNVISNAINHARASRILVGFRKRGHLVDFGVYDDGIGMDADELQQALQQGTKSASSEGEGLGLSIVQDFCADQGYGFDITSTAGAGTAVRVSLPLA